MRPVPKNSGLDPSELKNYRPVSNLTFLSKLLENVVQVRILAFFDRNRFMPKMQSAYRRFHSTETAVTKVVSDLLLAADGGQMSALCFLDLTAAFDTVDHELLLHRLERQFGLLEWFRSYLSGLVERSVSCLASVRRPSSTSSVECRKAQYSAVVHRVHIGHSSYCGEALCISTRVR